MIERLYETYLKTEENTYNKYIMLMYLYAGVYFLFCTTNYSIIDSEIHNERISTFLDIINTLSGISAGICGFIVLGIGIIVLIKSKVISIVLKMLIGTVISLFVMGLLSIVFGPFAVLLTLGIAIYTNRKRIALLAKYKRYFKYIALIGAATLISNIAEKSFIALLGIFSSELSISAIENILFFACFMPFVSIAIWAIFMHYILYKEVKVNKVSLWEVIKIINILPIILFLLIISLISLSHVNVDDGLNDVFASPLDSNDNTVAGTNDLLNGETVDNNFNNNLAQSGISNEIKTNVNDSMVTADESSIHDTNLNSTSVTDKNNVDFNTPDKDTLTETYQINTSDNNTQKIVINNDKGTIYNETGEKTGNIDLKDDKMIIKDNMGNTVQESDNHFIYDGKGKVTANIDNNSVDTVTDYENKEILINDNGTVYDGKTGEVKATIEKK